MKFLQEMIAKKRASHEAEEAKAAADAPQLMPDDTGESMFDEPGFQDAPQPALEATHEEVSAHIRTLRMKPSEAAAPPPQAKPSPEPARLRPVLDPDDYDWDIEGAEHVNYDRPAAEAEIPAEGEFEGDFADDFDDEDTQDAAFAEAAAPEPEAPAEEEVDLSAIARKAVPSSLRATAKPTSETAEEPAAEPTAARPQLRKIWDMDEGDDKATEDEPPQPAATSATIAAAMAPPPQPAPAAPPASETVAASAPAAPAKRRAGRVKTRLLGFHTEGEDGADPFSQDEKPAQVRTGSEFPVGWIIVTGGPGRGACFTLQTGVSKIGRGEDQTIRLDFGDTSISRDNHAAIAFDEEQDKFYVGHGGKANLVRLNDMPVLSTEPLNDGDTIRIGETALRFVALCGPEFSWNGGDETDARHEAAE